MTTTKDVLVFQADIDSYHRFRNSFEWNGNEKVQLYISGETTFVVHINGKRIPVTQLADVSAYRTWSEFNITDLLHTGENWIAVELHYLGANFLTYQVSEPFLWCQIVCGEVSLCDVNSGWEYQKCPCYYHNRACKVTGQLGYTFEFDSSKTQPWMCGEQNGFWQNAVTEKSSGKTFSCRTVPQLNELPVPETRIVQMGYLLRRCTEGTFANIAYRDYFTPWRSSEFFEQLPDSLKDEGGFLRKSVSLKDDGSYDMVLKPIPEGNDGAYLIVDTGKERVGYLTFSLNAPAGTVIDICHGEHLEDGRVRSSVGNRNFTDRYICHDGINEFTYCHRRLGTRYIELHLTCCGNGPVSIGYVGLIPLELPLAPEASFVSPDRLLSRINQVSSATLKLCMHEHYEDCPWREQALYAYDSRNQILYGYNVWGNYDFAAASLDLIGKNYNNDRYFPLTAPGRSSSTIPVFTLVWISELLEHWMHSGNDFLFRKWKVLVDKFLDLALDCKDPEFPGLYSSGTEKNYWNFCEWNGDLSYMKGNGQGPFNIYLYEALRSAEKMNRAYGNDQRADYLKEKAEQLGRSIESYLWRDNVQAYGFHASHQPDDKVYAHIQAIMLANNLVPKEKIPAVVRSFSSKTVRSYELSALQYVINGLMPNGADARKILLKELRDILDPIILSGATSIWETRYGAEDFDSAGSLCHGWSAAMPYYCRRAVLGVYPIESGFKKFAVSPYSAELPWAEGEVPTPHGFIKVKWEQTSSGLKISVQHPENCQPVLMPLEECPVASFEAVCMN